MCNKTRSEGAGEIERGCMGENPRRVSAGLRRYLAERELLEVPGARPGVEGVSCGA